MSDRPTFVLVGGGLTAGTAATTLRDEGFDGRVVLVGDEQEVPYERPPLSKGYLRGEEERSSAYVHDEAGWKVTLASTGSTAASPGSHGRGPDPRARHVTPHLLSLR